MSKESVRVSKRDLEGFVQCVFEAAGISEEHARIVAKHLVLANLRGIDSHGVSRVDIYCQRLDSGIVNKTNQVIAERESPSSLLIDGSGGMGIILATEAIRIAVKKAKCAGMAVVGIKDSSHCGMLADYTMYAAQQGCIAIVTTNAPSSMAPWGGKVRYFGTNPFSYGVPAGKENDIIFDMATSVVARGKIALALQNQQPIPLGWAISKEGNPTKDPAEALDGVILPVGGPKGYGLAFLVEVLSGLFTGAAYGPQIVSLYQDVHRKQNVGQFFFVMRADLFEELNVFKQRVDQMIREIRNIPLAEGFEKIYLPGEIELEKMAERETRGIPLSMKQVEELRAVGKRYAVSLPL